MCKPENIHSHFAACGCGMVSKFFAKLVYIRRATEPQCLRWRLYFHPRERERWALHFWRLPPKGYHLGPSQGGGRTLYSQTDYPAINGFAHNVKHQFCNFHKQNLCCFCGQVYANRSGLWNKMEIAHTSEGEFLNEDKKMPPKIVPYTKTMIYMEWTDAKIPKKRISGNPRETKNISPAKCFGLIPVLLGRDCRHTGYLNCTKCEGCFSFFFALYFVMCCTRKKLLFIVSHTHTLPSIKNTFKMLTKKPERIIHRTKVYSQG